jgi:copper chaperone
VKKMSQTILKVEGMTCNHCKMRTEKALQGVSGVESVKVDLAAKEAVITGDAERAQLVKAVVDAGYSVVE